MVQSRRKRRKKFPKETTPEKQAAVGMDPADAGVDLNERDRRKLAIVVLVLLSAFGIYKAFALWGAFPVPNPDFAAFVRSGNALWRFEFPAEFKRAPVVGFLMVGVGKCMGGDVLRAGWLINAVFSAGSVVLLWLVGRKVVGKAAPFIAVIAMLNPFVLRSQVNPIAETTMIFFTLLTFVLMFRHSRWVYVAASVASMVRYECTILILAAFLMDMVTLKTAKRRWFAFLWSALASIPFLLWMLGTYFNRENETSHYINHFIRAEGQKAIGWTFIRFFWEGTFQYLFKGPLTAKSVFDHSIDPLNKTQMLIFTVNKIVVIGGILSALIHTIWKRNKYSAALFVFLVFYLLVHSLREATHHRYIVPAAWACLLLCWFGYAQVWRLIMKRPSAAKIFKLVFPVIVILCMGAWLYGMMPQVTKVSSPILDLKGRNMAFVSMAILALIGLVTAAFMKFRHLAGFVALALTSFVMISSQNFEAMGMVGKSNYYIEFKYLMDWFEENTEPGERLCTRWRNTVNYMTATRRRDLVHTKDLASDTYEDFIRNCREKNITYITWCPRGSASTRRGLENIKPLLMNYNRPPPYLEPVKRIQLQNRRYWINIYRLMPEGEEKEKTGDNR